MRLVEEGGVVGVVGASAWGWCDTRGWPRGRSGVVRVGIGWRTVLVTARVGRSE